MYLSVSGCALCSSWIIRNLVIKAKLHFYLCWIYFNAKYIRERQLVVIFFEMISQSTWRGRWCQNRGRFLDVGACFLENEFQPFRVLIYFTTRRGIFGNVWICLFGMSIMCIYVQCWHNMFNHLLCRFYEHCMHVLE